MSILTVWILPRGSKGALSAYRFSKTTCIRWRGCVAEANLPGWGHSHYRNALVCNPGFWILEDIHRHRTSVAATDHKISPAGRLTNNHTLVDR